MKVIILCGGLGTRLSEETQIKPKPLVAIGGKPILWHIMNIYSHFGFNEFILALGYKGESIKEYFLNYAQLDSDFTIHLKDGRIENHLQRTSPWTVTMVDTGRETMTGGRLLRLQKHLAGEPSFMLTYGDGVANVDIGKLLSFHEQHDKIATITAVRPVARFGEMVINNDEITSFKEKPQTEQGWINGGFFVFRQGIFNYLRQGDQTILERQPLEALSSDGQLQAYKHHDFWQCMDTLRDKDLLEKIWASGDAPWASGNTLN